MPWLLLSSAFLACSKALHNVMGYQKQKSFIVTGDSDIERKSDNPHDCCDKWTEEEKLRHDTWVKWHLQRKNLMLQRK